MRRLRLRNLIIRLWLGRMNHIRELHRVLDEEDRDIVPHNIPITLLGVEFARKTTHIADCVSRATAAKHGRKAQEDGRLARRVRKDARGGDIGCRFEEGELAKSA
jgi:hypothetical protein